jgi:hypothetical protein
MMSDAVKEQVLDGVWDSGGRERRRACGTVGVGCTDFGCLSKS